jgi:signal transduction histidine kinase/CheY-like chemotaxis protein
MQSKSDSLIERKLKREVASRKAAEQLLEEKSLQLFSTNQQLEVALKQLEQRSLESFQRLEFKEKIERILIHFGRAFLRGDVDDILILDLLSQLNKVSDDIECELRVDIDLLPSLTQGIYYSSKLRDVDGSLLSQAADFVIPLETESGRIGEFRALIKGHNMDVGFVRSQMLIVFEQVASAIARQVTNVRLVKAKELAEESERATREFLAMINHELRTPLNGLLGSAELIGETNLTNLQKELHSNLSQSGEMLRSIINDLLDFSKMNAGMLALVEQVFNWHTLELTIRSIFEPKIAEKQLEFEIVSTVPDSLMLKGDLDRIKQIFVNLIGNAIKFTDVGSVSVVVTYQRGELQWQVTDTGIGISEEAQATLFNPFVQADRSSSRSYEGTGLGLAICKQLIELMDGSISLVSQPGQGTTFSVSIPLEGKKLSGADKYVQLEVPGNDAYSHLKILVVDDIKMNQIVITKMLSKLGISPDIATNGQEAVAMAQKEDYDLIFMDCRMPVMDGFEATRHLRELNYEKPIVALTAGTTREERETCFEVGMNDILPKPYTRNELHQALAKWS